jgi:hypothetical protein
MAHPRRCRHNDYRYCHWSEFTRSNPHLNRFFGRGYPTEQIYVVLDALGLLGLIFLMALAGMEVNIRIVKSEKRAVGWLSFLTFVIPAAAGFAVYAFLSPQTT